MSLARIDTTVEGVDFPVGNPLRGQARVEVVAMAIAAIHAVIHFSWRNVRVVGAIRMFAHFLDEVLSAPRSQKSPRSKRPAV
jgi:hypothetical protein